MYYHPFKTIRDEKIVEIQRDQIVLMNTKYCFITSMNLLQIFLSSLATSWHFKKKGKRKKIVKLHTWLTFSIYTHLCFNLLYRFPTLKLIMEPLNHLLFFIIQEPYIQQIFILEHNHILKQKQTSMTIFSTI